jgi:hypothetical protein
MLTGILALVFAAVISKHIVVPYYQADKPLYIIVVILWGIGKRDQAPYNQGRKASVSFQCSSNAASSRIRAAVRTITCGAFDVEDLLDAVLGYEINYRLQVLNKATMVIFLL